MTDRATRDQIANVISDAIDNEGDISPTLAADDLIAAGLVVPPGALTFAQLSETNRSRCARWYPDFLDADADWTLADWSNAAAGEMGEACNVVKKIRRAQVGIPGAADPEDDVLYEALGDEIADTVIYLDLLATKAGIDLAAAVARKFNAVSKREGFPEWLSSLSGEG